MSVMIAGGDYIETIAAYLKQLGADEILHRSCRKESEASQPLPKRLDAILMLTSYLGHSSMQRLRSEARRQGIPVLYAKRSLVDVKRQCEGPASPIRHD
nr:DUF2325 domain-containing protein [uncultured Holophaga sp.]